MRNAVLSFSLGVESLAASALPLLPCFSCSLCSFFLRSLDARRGPLLAVIGISASTLALPTLLGVVLSVWSLIISFHKLSLSEGEGETDRCFALRLEVGDGEREGDNEIEYDLELYLVGVTGAEGDTDRDLGCGRDPLRDRIDFEGFVIAESGSRRISFWWCSWSCSCE